MKPTPLEHIDGLVQADVQLLRNAGVTSVEQLWERIAEDPEFLGGLAFPTPADRVRVAELIATDGLESSKQITAAPIVSHVADILLLLLVLGTAAGLFLKGLNVPAPKMGTTVVVAADRGIPPFQAIRGGDVKVIGSATAGATLADVVGRYSFEYLPMGARVDTSALSDKVLFPDLPSLNLLQVSFESDSSLLGLKPPAEIALLVPSPDGTTMGVLVEPVYVLRMKPAEDHIAAVIGMKAAELQRAAPLMRGAKLTPILSRP